MYRKYSHTGTDQHNGAFCKSNFSEKFEKFRQHFFDEETGFPKRHQHAQQAGVATNIREQAAYCEIQLFAAGRKKDAFKIELQDNLLTISYEETMASQEASYIHQEYWPSAFRRTFQLNDQVLTETIHASFEDGVLTVIVPKDPAAAKTVKDVKID